MYIWHDHCLNIPDLPFSFSLRHVTPMRAWPADGELVAHGSSTKERPFQPGTNRSSFWLFVPCAQWIQFEHLIFLYTYLQHDWFLHFQLVLKLHELSLLEQFVENLCAFCIILLLILILPDPSSGDEASSLWDTVDQQILSIAGWLRRRLSDVGCAVFPRFSIVCGIYSSCTTPLHYCISVKSSQTLLRCYHIFLCLAVLMLASWNFPWPQSCVFLPFRAFLGPCCVCCLSFYFGSLCISFYPFFFDSMIYLFLCLMLA